MKKIALIGFGAIARIMRQKLAEHDPDGNVSISGVLVRENRLAETKAALGADIPAVTTIGALLAFEPDIVVECAGQGAIVDYAETVLTAGYDLMVISTGALADDDLRQRLIAAAESGMAHMVLPAGAIAGIDGLNALRIGGLKSVRYTSTKPPGGEPLPRKLTTSTQSPSEPFFTPGQQAKPHDFIPRTQTWQRQSHWPGLACKRPRSSLWLTLPLRRTMSGVSTQRASSGHLLLSPVAFRRRITPRPQPAPRFP